MMPFLVNNSSSSSSNICCLFEIYFQNAILKNNVRMLPHLHNRRRTTIHTHISRLKVSLSACLVFVILEKLRDEIEERRCTTIIYGGMYVWLWSLARSLLSSIDKILYHPTKRRKKLQRPLFFLWEEENERERGKEKLQS